VRNFSRALAQARCHSEADVREAAKLSTSRRQNSDHGGPWSIRSRRRSASRRHLSRPSVSCCTDAEKIASRARASSLIERDCSTSMRKRFISMSSSFSSRRMTGNGSGASQGWVPRNGLMMTTFAPALIWRGIACRSVVYSWLRYRRTLEISKLCAQRLEPQRCQAEPISTPPIVQAHAASVLRMTGLMDGSKSCTVSNRVHRGQLGVSFRLRDGLVAHLWRQYKLAPSCTRHEATCAGSCITW
jgi:hypothetical protein